MIKKAINPNEYFKTKSLGLGCWAWGTPKWGWNSYDPNYNDKTVFEVWNECMDKEIYLIDTSDD